MKHIYTSVRKFITHLLVAGIILAAGMTDRVLASHAMGADLTYECLGGNNYLVRFSFYRDCIGISAPATAYVTINSSSCGQSLGVTCYPIAGTGQEVLPLCPSALSTCQGGVYTGIQEWVYEGIVTLPMQCTDWTFGYTLCCRNAAITNITTPGSNTFFLYATLNNTIAPCNNSPTFSNKPVPFACLGQQFCFNHGAYDTDGDSLVYTLITPMQTSTTTVNYINPHTATQPLTSSPPVAFSNSTGDICMTPQALEVTVMAVLVSEYRNGVLIGTCERDIQVTVMNCTNTLPTLTGINGSNDFDLTICANQTTCFDIFSADPDSTQNVFISWNNAISSATFTSSGGPRPTGTFCWTPATGDISSVPYCFTVKVQDDACPYFGNQVYSYCITVTGIDVSAGPDQTIACNDLATITATVTGGTAPYTYQWSNGFTNPTQTVGTGTYVVTVTDANGCSDQDTVLVANTNIPTALFSHSPATCLNTPIQFTDESIVPGGVIISWQWNFGDGSTSGLQDPVHQYSGPGTYNVTLIIETSLGCIDTVMMPITISPPPVASFTAPSGCVGQTVNFNNTSVPPGSSWWWNFGDGSTSSAEDPIHTYTNPGTYTVTLVVGDSLGCVDTVQQQITIDPLPNAAFTFNPPCSGNLVSFFDSSTGNVITWYWNFGNGSTSSNEDPTTTYPAPGTYTVTLVVGSANGCMDTLVQTITIDPPPTVNAGPDQHICIGGSATLTASGGVIYTWYPGGQTGTVVVSPTDTTPYVVIVTDGNGCTASDTVVVFVHPPPTPLVSSNQNLCIGDSVTLTASGGTSYTWQPTGDTSSTITVSPTNNTTYAVTVTDSFGCNATAFVDVLVHNLPSVSLAPVFICQGDVATLNAGNAGSTYVWSSGATTQTITVSTAGTYTVTVINSYGCTATASAIVSVGDSVALTMANVAFCNGQTTVLNAGNPGSTYTWSNGATTQTITVGTAGTYNVTVTNGSGCTGTISTTVNVHPLPVADFTSGSVCFGDTTFFNDISSVTSGNVVSWQWNLGDGNFSSQQNPFNTYINNGTYSVSLIVISDSGCVDTITKNVSVNPLPVASFSVANACEGETVNFNNTSTISSGNITSWNWNFGNGTTSNSQSPSYQYPSPGLYNVILQVTSAGGCSDTAVLPIRIWVKPVADFSFNNVCLNTPTQFNNSSTVSPGTITATNWDFGDGTTSTNQNPTHVFTSAGTYNVTLIATTNRGCMDTIVKTVTVYPLPVADAGINQTICSGATVTLNATGGTSYQWNPTGATSPSVNVTPSVTTTYNVIVTDANGCSATDSVRVFVNPKPNANAGPNQSMCVGGNVTLSASGGVSYVWNPGGATTSSITVNPASTSSYIVTVTDINGCTNSDTVFVTVNSLPVAAAGPDQTICEGSTAALTATGGNSFYWTHSGETSQTVFVSPSANSSYSVVVTDSNGCSDSDTMNVIVNTVPVVQLFPTFICAGFTTTLDAGNPGASFIWSTGDTTQTLVVSDSGTYSVIVTAANGCVSSASTIVTVGGPLVVNVPNVQICSGNSAVLNAGNPGYQYLWSTGATTQTITVSTAGTYTITLTDPNGCTGAFSSDVIVNPLPQVNFSANSACHQSITSFTNLSTISSGGFSGFSWNFGNGNLSVQNNPVHTYGSPGTYNVTLTITSSAGCTSSLTQPVVVKEIPAANFNFTNACLNAPNSFTDLSSIVAGNTITGWSWSFGDGSTSAAQNPSHVYSTNGNYNVTLIVTSDGGCTDTITHNVLVHPLPVVSFVVPNTCMELTSQFTNGSTISNGFINSYTWNFGDGNTSSAQDPVHTYVNSGTYNVSLTVTSALGCSATVSMPVESYPKPVSDFIANDACQSDSIHFDDESSVITGSINNWYWTFGDGGSDGNINPVHYYNSPGTFNVALIVTTDHGCLDTMNKQVRVHPMPVADFTANDQCQVSTVQFNENTYIVSGNITGWSWNFGDGNSASGQSATHTYSAPGTYQVSMVATSDYGCVDTATRGLNIFPMPQVSFSAAPVCYSNITQFYDQTNIPGGGGGFTYNWDFGDGNTSTLQNPSNLYASSGTFNVSLTVTTSNGCTATSTAAVTVYQLPAAMFTANDVCLGDPVDFNDLSVSTGSAIVNWNWNFGDGGVSSSKDPMHNYSSPGTYPVTLTVMNSNGCSSSYTDSVNVMTKPTAQISVSNGCEDDDVTFINTTNSGVAGTTTWLWTFGDGNTSTDSIPVHQYAQPGTYTVTLQATNANSCSSVATATVVISPKPVADFQFINPCEGQAVQFTDLSTISSGSITAWNWNFGDGSPLSSIQNPSHIYTAAGTYNVTLIVTSDNGCVDTVMQSITIHPTPVADFSSLANAGCGPLPVSFFDSSFVLGGTIVSWAWDFGDGNSSNAQNPVHVYQQSGNYTVSLTVTSNNGCVSSYSINNLVTVYPGPYADFEPEPPVASILHPVIDFNNLSSGAISYTWYFGDGGMSSQFEPSHTYHDTGWYNVTLIVVNQYGCIDTITKPVYIQPEFTLWVPNCFTPNGDGKNDDFNISGIGIVEMTMYIYNRWGDHIYTQNHMNSPWKGAVNNDEELAQQDVYVYDLIVKDVFGRTHTRIGHVSLVR